MKIKRFLLMDFNDTIHQPSTFRSYAAMSCTRSRVRIYLRNSSKIFLLLLKNFPFLVISKKLCHIWPNNSIQIWPTYSADNFSLVNVDEVNRWIWPNNSESFFRGFWYDSQITVDGFCLSIFLYDWISPSNVAKQDSRFRFIFSKTTTTTTTT